jgi:hypothetical protein
MSSSRPVVRGLTARPPAGIPVAAMSVKRALLLISLVSVLSLLLSLAIQASFAQEADAPEADTALGVEWAFRPDSLPDLVEEAPAIVMAEVEGVRSGEQLVLDPGEAGQEPALLPTQRIDVRVTAIVDGETPDRFTLFKLGSPTLYAKGDPPYAVGERYLLFVLRRHNDEGTAPNPDGTWLPVAPDGRLERTSSGELSAQIAGPVAQELDGDTVPEARGEIAAAEAGSP